MDKKIFYDLIRDSVFGGKLSQTQVEGLEFILAEADKRKVNNEYLAYLLATTAWETARTMEPIREYGSESYLRSKKYYPHVGMGYVQLTWETNYEKATRYFQDILGIDVDFVKNPKLLLQPEYAVIILFEGMDQGWFTGKDLDDYLDGVDEDDKEDLREFSNARRIINGTDRQVEIGMIALDFEEALRDSGRADTGSQVETPTQPEKPSEEPVVAEPDPVSHDKNPTISEKPQKVAQGGLAAVGLVILGVILKALGVV